MVASMTPMQRYQALTAQKEVVFDDAQQQALMALQQLHQQIILPKQSQAQAGSCELGLYLWGKVGRGKTFLMDTFVASLPTGVGLRQHFHHFMQDVHHQLTRLSGKRDPLKHIAKQLRQDYQVLCFDEFFVSDIGDAMLLGRLIMFLFEQGMVVVATSNCEPSALYKDGLQRERFLPAIDSIYKNMQVIELAGIHDHRERQFERLNNYFVINENNELPIKNMLARYHLNVEPSGQKGKASGVLEVLGREIHYLAMNDRAIAFDFSDLCLGPRSHFDYIELAKQFSVIILMKVPALGGDAYERIKARGTEDGSIGSGNIGERQVMLAPMDDGARRFIALVDELYDQQVILYLTSYVPFKELYTHGSLAFQFERASSRLIEMGTEEYINGFEKASSFKQN